MSRLSSIQPTPEPKLGLARAQPRTKRSARTKQPARTKQLTGTNEPIEGDMKLDTTLECAFRQVMAQVDVLYKAQAAGHKEAEALALKDLRQAQIKFLRAQAQT